MSGKLKALTEKTFDAEVNATSGTIVVDFWASWCGPCRMLTPIVEKVQEDLAGKVKIYSVNIDDEPGLMKRFKIKGVPTLLVFENGDLAKTSVGLVSKEKVLKLVEK